MEEVEAGGDDICWTGGSLCVIGGSHEEGTFDREEVAVDGCGGGGCDCESLSSHIEEETCIGGNKEGTGCI